MANGNGDNEDIGELEIVPEAEERTNGSANAIAKAEDKFFQAGGVEERLKHNQQNLGWLGKFFGSSSTAPTNIAGLVIGCSMLFYIASFCFTPSPDLSDMRKFLGTIITSALGFIVGAATKK